VEAEKVAEEDELVPGAGELGELRLSFQYMTSEHCLIVTVHETRKVEAKFKNLFVKVRLVSGEHVTLEKVKTQVKSGKENPTFEEIFTFRKIEQPVLKTYTLTATVMDKQAIGNDTFVGEFRFKLKKLNAEQGLPKFYPLKSYKHRPKSISGLEAFLLFQELCFIFLLINYYFFVSINRLNIQRVATSWVLALEPPLRPHPLQKRLRRRP